MKPYYGPHNGITIYHGDCRDVLLDGAWFGVDAVVTDPPYGIDYGNAGGSSAEHGWASRRGAAEWDKERPSREVFSAILALSVPTVIWGGNYFTDYLPPRMGWISWDKGQRNFSLADFELAWTSEQKAARAIVYPRGKAQKDGRYHPTQKPLFVMEQCIHYLERSSGKHLGRVLDPFMGSGTTLVAAKRLGKSCVGIEREERYCEIAAKRLSQEALPLEVA